MPVPAVKHILYKHGGASPSCQSGHEHRLGVGGKAGIGGGAHRTDSPQPSPAVQGNPVPQNLDFTARLLEAGGHRGQTGRIRPLQLQPPAGGSRRA